jgi:hypothetical protein
MCSSLDVLVVIGYCEDGHNYGATAWVTTSGRDYREYHEHRKKIGRIDMPGKDMLAQVLAEADAMYEAEQRGDELPPIDEATVEMPNLFKSKTIHVRVSESEHDRLAALAAEKQVRVSDVIRAAVSVYLRSDRREAEELVAALHQRGIRLVSSEPSS